MSSKRRRLISVAGLCGVAFLGTSAVSSAEPTVSPATLNFGTVGLHGMSAPQTVTMSVSATDVQRQIALFVPAGGGAFQITSTTCPKGSPLPAGDQSCTATLVLNGIQPLPAVTGRFEADFQATGLGGPQTVTKTATLTGSVSSTQSARKKCKKKRSAAEAKKKCKKKH
jgi:hypothetical protein